MNIYIKNWMILQLSEKYLNGFNLYVCIIVILKGLLGDRLKQSFKGLAVTRWCLVSDTWLSFLLLLLDCLGLGLPLVSHHALFEPSYA